MGWIIFLLSEVIMILILHFFVWTFWQQMLNELEFDVKFCEFEEEIFQAYQPNIE